MRQIRSLSRFQYADYAFAQFETDHSETEPPSYKEDISCKKSAKYPAAAMED